MPKKEDMLCIISGTDRVGSNSLIIAKQLLKFYKLNNIEAEIIDLKSLPLHKLHGISYVQKVIPDDLRMVLEKIEKAKALHMVCPEYNGSYPGILKFFMDYWEFPAASQKQLVAFVGLGGRFSGLRPVEHLMQIFSYRNAVLYPQRVFLTNVWDLIKEESLVDSAMLERLKKQAEGFGEFINLPKA